MSRLPRTVLTRYRRAALLGLVSVLALVLVGRWLNATKRGGQEPAEPFRIARGDRVAQLVVAAVAPVRFERVEALPDTARGEGGFGSTGVKGA